VSAVRAAEEETILLVDSDAVGRALIGDYLRGCGYRVLEAGTIAEAKQALGQQAVDIAVVDVALREESGFELAAWIRTSRPQVRVILTGSVERAASLAGDLCDEGPELMRPFHPQQLLDRIKRLRRR
jgi:DNA-binding response OmpR family regulator